MLLTPRFTKGVVREANAALASECSAIVGILLSAFDLKFKLKLKLTCTLESESELTFDCKIGIVALGLGVTTSEPITVVCKFV